MLIPPSGSFLFPEKQPGGQECFYTMHSCPPGCFIQIRVSVHTDRQRNPDRHLLSRRSLTHPLDLDWHWAYTKWAFYLYVINILLIVLFGLDQAKVREATCSMMREALLRML
jgi:hypothetical protein